MCGLASWKMRATKVEINPRMRRNHFPGQRYSSVHEYVWITQDVSDTMKAQGGSCSAPRRNV